jgi:hypothetical protein
MRKPVKIRCMLDGLLHHAEMSPCQDELVVFDNGETFVMDALEALYYQLVSATPDEILKLERSRYRLLRRAADFDYINE